TLPAAMEHAVAHGAEKNRLHAVPPIGGGDLHCTKRGVRDAVDLCGARFILVVIHPSPQPTAARPATYRFAVFVARHRSPPRISPPAASLSCTPPAGDCGAGALPAPT